MMVIRKSKFQEAKACLHVEFKVRISDLRNAAQRLTLNQGQNKTTDFADILVSERVATFCTVGTSTDVPVNGIKPGTARIPISTLEKAAAISKTFKKKETLVLIWDGLIKVGSWQTIDLEIALGAIPDQSLELPSGASFLDTLALAWLFSPVWVKEQGLDTRVAIAQKARENAIDSATRAMEPFQVEREKIAALVENHIANAGKDLRKRLRGSLPK